LALGCGGGAVFWLNVGVIWVFEDVGMSAHCGFVVC
jgi:hypothetical protein